MKRLVILGAILVLAASAPATAGVGSGNGELGFDLGWTDFDSSVTNATGGRAVFRGGYHITDLFELEGHIGCSAATDTSLGFDVDIALCTSLVDAVFNFRNRSGNIVPYVLGGIGSARSEEKALGLSVTSDASAYQFAAGIRFFVGSNKKMAWRVEASSLTETTSDITSTHT